jgi:hypothetical protein
LRSRVGRKTSSNDAISAEVDVLPLLRSDDAAAVKTGRGGPPQNSACRTEIQFDVITNRQRERIEQGCSFYRNMLI